MVNSKGVLSGQNAYVVPQAGEKEFLSSRDCDPFSVLRSYPVCYSCIIVHAPLISYLFIEICTLSLVLNNEQGTQSLRLEYHLK